MKNFTAFEICNTRSAPRKQCSLSKDKRICPSFEYVFESKPRYSFVTVQGARPERSFKYYPPRGTVMNKQPLPSVTNDGQEGVNLPLLPSNDGQEGVILPLPPSNGSPDNSTQLTNALKIPAMKNFEGSNSGPIQTKNQKKENKSPFAILNPEFSPGEELDVDAFEKDVNMDLTHVQVIKAPENVIGKVSDKMFIKLGVHATWDSEAKEFRPGKPIKRPLFLLPEERPLYYATVATLMWSYSRGDQLSETILRFIEAGIKANRLKAGGRPSTMVTNTRKFLGSPAELLMQFWEEMKDSHMDIFAIGDELSGVSLTVYTGGVPPYKTITHIEAQRLILQFLKCLFSDVIPPRCQEKSFVEGFLRHLCVVKGVSSETFRKSVDKVGVPFENGFAHIPYLSETVLLEPYNKTTFITDRVINANYKAPTIEDNYITLSAGCKLFLENICYNDPYIYSVLRGLIRNVITSKHEGAYYQSAVWVCGPPACAKSIWVKLLKQLVAKAYVTEFAHVLNQFTGSDLQKSKLLILSDITSVSKAQYQLLKPILGRDNVRVEQKYVQKVDIVDPVATIVCVSNFKPTDLPYLQSDQALLEKLIVVEFPSEASIPPELQVPNVIECIQQYLPEIMNWAMFAPVSVLRNQIRATTYNKYLLQKTDRESIGGIVGYMRDFLAYSSNSEDFVVVNSLISHMKQVEEVTGDDFMIDTLGESNRQSATAVPRVIIDTAKNVFKRTLNLQRYSKRDLGTRPKILTNLKFRTSLDKPFPEGAELFDFPNMENKIILDPPFYAEQKICWLQLDETNSDDFIKSQIAIRERRELLSKKEVNLLPPPLTTEIITQSNEENENLTEIITQSNEATENESTNTHDPILGHEIVSEDKLEPPSYAIEKSWETDEDWVKDFFARGGLK